MLGDDVQTVLQPVGVRLATRPICASTGQKGSITNANQSAYILFVAGSFPQEQCRRISLLTRRRDENVRQPACRPQLGVEHFHRKRLGFHPPQLKNPSLLISSTWPQLLNVAILTHALQRNHALN